MADDLSEYIILEIRVSLYPGILGRGEGRGGEARKMSGMEGERIGVNCVAWEGEFQHWL